MVGVTSGGGVVRRIGLSIELKDVLAGGGSMRKGGRAGGGARVGVGNPSERDTSGGNIVRGRGVGERRRGGGEGERDALTLG